MPGFGAQRLPNPDWSEPEDVSSNALLGRMLLNGRGIVVERRGNTGHTGVWRQGSPQPRRSTQSRSVRDVVGIRNTKHRGTAGLSPPANETLRELG